MTVEAAVPVREKMSSPTCRRHACHQQKKLRYPCNYGICFSSQSFWKAGSPRKGSQSGSSLRRAGVMGGGP